MSSSVVNKMLSLSLVLGLVLSAFNPGALAAEEIQEGPVPTSTTPTDAEILTGDDVTVYLVPDDEVFDSVTPAPVCNQNADIPISYDNALLESFLLYMQSYPDSLEEYEYDVALDDRLFKQEIYAYPARPAVVTTATGTIVYYVGIDFRVYSLNLDTGSAGAVFKENADQSDREFVTSIAVSQDGKRLAYLRISCNAGELVYDKSIHVRDIEVKTADTVTTNTADNSVPPVLPYEQFEIQPDNDAWGIGHLGSLAFDYTGTKLVFDINTCPVLDDGSCGTAPGFWSFGVLDLTDRKVQFPVSDQSDKKVDLRYPSFAYNNNNVLVMDYHDREAGTAAIKTYNLLEQADSFKQVVNLHNVGDWGVPSFWGDDKYVTIQKRTESGGVSISRVPLNEDWSGDFANIMSLNEFDAVLPIMHRKAIRSLTVELDAESELLTDGNVLDFGNLDPGEEKVFKVKIRNSGNVDTEIKGFTLPNTAFSHNGVTTYFPKDQSITLDIGFKGGANEGTQMGELTVSYGEGYNLTFSLIATVGKDFKRAVLQGSEAALNFGQVLANENSSLSFDISNQGDEAAVITAIEWINENTIKYFTHDAAENMTVPANGKVTINVEYNAGDKSGIQSDSLVFHYGMNGKVIVLLSARTVNELTEEADEADEADEGDPLTDTGDPVTEGGSSRTSIGGGTDGSAGLSSVSYFLMLVLAMRIMFYPTKRRFV